MKKIIFFLGLWIFLTGCRDHKETVTVYTTVDRVFSEPVLKQFERETGIRVKALYDTEETKSTGILNRILAEKAHPRCDLFWSGDPVRAILLKQEGISRPYTIRNARDIPALYKDPEGHWTGFSARARVLVYHTNRLPDSLVPRSLFDLTQPAYKNKITMANPLFGTTTFHIAALFVKLGDARAKQWLDSLEANGLQIAASNGDVMKRVAQGDQWIGLTDTDDAFEAQREGKPAAWIFPDQENGFGTLIMPNTISLIRNSPHPHTAQRLAEYLLRPETEIMLARSCAQMPLHPHTEVPAGVPVLDSIVPMQVDYETTARRLPEIMNYLKKRFHP